MCFPTIWACGTLSWTIKASDRPLLKYLDTMEAFQEFVGKHLFERSVFYNQAQYSVRTDGKTIAEVVTEIKKILT